jgi:hypothetical protein
MTRRQKYAIATSVAIGGLLLASGDAFRQRRDVPTGARRPVRTTSRPPC